MDYVIVAAVAFVAGAGAGIWYWERQVAAKYKAALIELGSKVKELY